MQTTSNNKTLAAVLLLLPLIGMLGLYLAELAHVLTAASAEAPVHMSGLPPFSLIQVILMISSLPILLLLLAWNRVTRWLALAVVGLMLLFHLLHLIEHLMMSDYIAAVWILLMCALANAIAAKAIWNEKIEVLDAMA